MTVFELVDGIYDELSERNLDLCSQPHHKVRGNFDEFSM